MAQDRPDGAIQKSFTTNGNTTLATAGKYCDKNIEVFVRVPVPDGYVKPSGSKTITENGTYDVTKYANAEVNVPQKATQFVNVLEYADSFVINQRFDTTGNSYQSYSPNGNVAVTLNLNNLPGGNPMKKNNNYFRFRGCAHVDAAFCQSADGVTYEAKGLNTMYHSIDEYGDMVFNRGYITGPYVRFNIGLNTGLSSNNSALADDFDPVAAGCIVTIDEPIGNGGYTG